MPADPSDGRQWQVFHPGPLDLDIALDTSLRATWAPLVVVLVLTLVVLRGRERPVRRVVAGAVLLVPAALLHLDTALGMLAIGP